MSTTATGLSEREAVLVRLSDVELVSRIYGLVREIDNDALSDEFYFYLTEAFERFAPGAEWESQRASYTPEERANELGATQERMAARGAARWMARNVT